MAFGFPANYKETHVFSFQRHEFSPLIKEVLEQLEWDFKEISTEEIHSTSKLTLNSYGEKIEIKILPDGMLFIESKGVYPFQLFDWGKNKQNVQILVAKINFVEKRIRHFEAKEGISVSFDKEGSSRVERIIDDKQ